MSCRTDIIEPIELLPDGIDETVLEVEHVNGGEQVGSLTPVLILESWTI